MKVKAVLLTGLLAAIVAGLFPPWVNVWHRQGQGPIEKPAGLGFVFKPPLPDPRLFLPFTLAGRGPMRTPEQIGPDEKVDDKAPAPSARPQATKPMPETDIIRYIRNFRFGGPVPSASLQPPEPMAGPVPIRVLRESRRQTAIGEGRAPAADSSAASELDDLVVQFSVRVDLVRLVIEWFLIAFTVSAALVALRPTATTR